MTTVDAMADEIMKGLTDYADLADTSMKKAVRKTAKSVKDEISANAPKRTGAYSKSWTAKKTKDIHKHGYIIREEINIIQIIGLI